MHKKVTKNPEADVGHYKPRSAADRTENLWKHQCIHCRGWTPCESENLEWRSTCSSPSSDANGFASSGGQQQTTLEESSVDYASEEEVAASGEDDEWRDALSNAVSSDVEGR